MGDIENRIRSLFEEISEPVDIDSVIAQPPQKQPLRRGWLPAAAAAVAVLIVGGLSLVLLRSGREPADTSTVSVTTAETATTAPSSTAIATTTTTSPTTTSVAATTTTGPPAAAPTGPIVIADSAERIGVQVGGLPPFTLNPFLGDGAVGLMSDLDPLLFGGAWRPGPDGEPIADLVEVLPSEADGTAVARPDGSATLTYRIRPDAVWSDGTPVTAADFDLTLDLLHSTELGIRSDWVDWHRGVNAFTTVSDTGFQVTMNPPYTRYRHLFPVVVPAHVVDPATFAQDWNETLWPSRGSMRLVSFERSSAPLAGVMTLEPNPHTSADPLVSEGLRIDFYQRDERGDSLAIEAFNEGRADLLAPAAFGPFELDRITDTAEFARAPAAIFEILFLQPGPERLEVNPDSKIDDPAVRFALAAALLADDGTLPGARITSLVEYFIPGAVNPDGGWDGLSAFLSPGDPVRLVYESTDGETTTRIGRAVEPLLGAAGFDVELRFDPDTFAAFTRWAEGGFEAFATRLVRTPGPAGLHELLGAFVGDEFPDVWPDLSTREALEHALAGFAGSLDPEARLEYLNDAEQALVSAMTVIPLVTRESHAWAYSPARIGGPTDYPVRESFLADVGSWQRP